MNSIQNLLLNTSLDTKNSDDIHFLNACKNGNLSIVQQILEINPHLNSDEAFLISVI